MGGPCALLTKPARCLLSPPPFPPPARRGDGPTLIEFETYRYRGHSLADPDELREKAEKDFYAARDPIPVRAGGEGGGHAPARACGGERGA